MSASASSSDEDSDWIGWYIFEFYDPTPIMVVRRVATLQQLHSEDSEWDGDKSAQGMDNDAAPDTWDPGM